MAIRSRSCRSGGVVAAYALATSRCASCWPRVYGHEGDPAILARSAGPRAQQRRLPAADVYTASTAFVILESIRLDLGIGSQVHP